MSRVRLRTLCAASTAALSACATTEQGPLVPGEYTLVALDGRDYSNGPFVRLAVPNPHFIEVRGCSETTVFVQRGEGRLSTHVQAGQTPCTPEVLTTLAKVRELFADEPEILDFGPTLEIETRGGRSARFERAQVEQVTR